MDANAVSILGSLVMTSPSQSVIQVVVNKGLDRYKAELGRSFLPVPLQDVSVRCECLPAYC